MFEALKMSSFFHLLFVRLMFFFQVNELQFSHWVEDVLAVVENLTDGPIILVNQILHLQTSCSALMRGSFSLTIN